LAVAVSASLVMLVSKGNGVAADQRGRAPGSMSKPNTICFKIIIVEEIAR